MHTTHTGGRRPLFRPGPAAVLLLAAALLASGCSGGGGADASGAARNRPYAPAPAAGAPQGGSARAAAPAGATPGTRDGEPTAAADGADAAMRSTFALDVDTASYGYARRTLAGGRLPEPQDVRPEEFVNSFRQDYPEPGGDGFSVTVDGARTAGGDGGWSLLRVGLATRSEDPESRAPADLTFVVDTSGSMAETGRLDLVRRALNLLIDRLRPQDSMAIVSFSTEARLRVPAVRPVDAAARRRLHEAVDGLSPEESTNLEAGLSLGYRQAAGQRREGAVNRVVVLSDGLANTGATSSETILERVSKARREEGITLFGVGVGSQYGDQLMEQLADRGDGHTSYVADDEDARKVFVDQLPANLDLRARDAKAQVAFDPAAVDSFRLIGFDDRRLPDQAFRDDRVDGGEVGPGHSVTALYAVRLKRGADGPLATATVHWLDPRSRQPHEAEGRIGVGDLSAGLWTEAPRRLQVDAVAAYFADRLRQSPTRREYGDGPDDAAVPFAPALPGEPSLEELADRADRLAAVTEDPDVRRLADAVGQAAGLLDS
ncbi:vWA domain-containing protein [Streptacidiphilus griseoplanus]|uniref:vWA domain-containing protein n=1 Tax=Peterkaempfera griseoplana TaxID=66896 RepID=UPI0006E428EC|nr:von Willebrand factor type A domain-containing protein [Peterkaempfera griseoplana]